MSRPTNNGAGPFLLFVFIIILASALVNSMSYKRGWDDAKRKYQPQQIEQP